jgi:hypothetical protein
MGRALLYYLAQAQTADRYRQAQRDQPAGAASQARHMRAPRRRHRALTLLAAAKRRVLTLLAGGSPSRRTVVQRKGAVPDRAFALGPALENEFVAALALRLNRDSSDVIPSARPTLGSS